MVDKLDHLVEAMMSDNDEEVTRILMVESEKDDVTTAMGGNVTLMNYLMLFEEFLEDYDIYLFDGWDKAQVIGAPKVEKFWVTFDLLIDDKTDIRGAKRIKDGVDQCEVTMKRLRDGSRLVRFMILKRDLDRIETLNQERIEELSDIAMEHL